MPKKGIQEIQASAAEFSQRKPYPDIGFFQSLTKGQDPSAILICCSDSRIVPNLITESRPGELFVIRNAGNIIPSFNPHTIMPDSMIASIEYAITVLEIQEIIVCGHSNCGAMTSLVNPDSIPSLPVASKWLKYYAAEALENAKKKHHDHPDGSDELLIKSTIEKNVLLQIEHLKTHPVVQEAIAAGKLKIHAWVYDVGTRVMQEYSEEKEQFVPLKNDKVNTASDDLKEPSRDETMTPFNLTLCQIL